MFNLLAEEQNIGENVIQSLNVFWKGMLAIAIVIALVIAATVIMNLIARRVSEAKAAKEAEKAEAENTVAPTDDKE